jgi:hypothetical protein
LPVLSAVVVDHEATTAKTRLLLTIKVVCCPWLGILVCGFSDESPARLASVPTTMAPVGVVFLHGGVAVKFRHLTHHRGVISGENHDSALPDWRWRRLRRRFFVESIALETVRGAYATGADLVFGGSGHEPPGRLFISWCYQDGVFFKTGQVLPLLADSRRSRADGTLTRVVSMKWFFGCSRGWSPFGSCWAWHVLVVVVVAVVVANLLISGGGRKAL